MIGFEEFKYRRKFLVPIGLAITVSFLLALGHVQFGTILQKTLSAKELLTLNNYVFNISFWIGLLIPVGYYIRRKDITETLAITAALAWALLISGLEDVFVYLLHPDALPAKLPWLDSGIIGAWAHLIGQETVTDFALLSWIIVSGITTVILIELLYEFEEYGL